jgi:hypothetical protein
MVLWLRCGWTQQDKREDRTSHHQLMRLGLLVWLVGRIIEGSADCLEKKDGQ